MLEFIKEILKMTEMDLIWGIPYIYFMQLIIKNLYYSYKEIGKSTDNKNRQTLLYSLRDGKISEVKRILQDDNDTVLNEFKGPLSNYINGRITDISQLKANLKEHADFILNEEMPREKAIDTSNGNLTFLGFLGTLAAMMLLFSHFTLEVNDFSHLFKYMGTAIKSSAFCIATSIITSELISFLDERHKITKWACRKFYLGLLDTLALISSRKATKRPMYKSRILYPV